ncbi:MAG: hypothetical protein GX625_14300 [Clostridiaceae bacterium]|nr:hypothetical protein [Clostridiaceae bacterium]
MRSYKTELEYMKQQDRRLSLDKLIEDRIYEHDLATLKQLAIDKGYTQEWFKRQVAQLNRHFLELAKQALAECNAKIDSLEAERDKIKGIYYQQNYSATDYADLQFLQTLIKTRLLNEAQNQPILAERILGEYIDTQKGARAIMFLANDSDIGKLVKPFYSRAAEQAQSASEKRFNADKAAELNQADTQIIELTKTTLIGGALVKVAADRVRADERLLADSIYFSAAENGAGAIQGV